MTRLLLLAGASLAFLGCTLKLPDIPPNHPASTGAPAGRTYATPAVLEVRPLVRPPDRPMTRPAHPYPHESKGMTPMGEMPVDRHEMESAHNHGGIVDPTSTLPAPKDKGHRDQMEGKGQQRMQREGQLHE